MSQNYSYGVLLNEVMTVQIYLLREYSIDLTPLSEIHGLAHIVFAAWSVDISQGVSGRNTSV